MIIGDIMKVKNIVLGIGIVIVFALALWQGVEAFYPSPQWDNYCGSVEIPRLVADKDVNFYNNQTLCLENNGTWRNGYCDYYSECQESFDEAMDKHAMYTFFISIIVGIIIIIVGYSILSIEPVGSALIASGIWAFFYGSVVNWRNFSDIWRFLLLLAALVLLILFAIHLNRNKKGKWWDFRR